MIQTLIESPDSVEIVKTQVAAILKNELLNQMAIATAEGKDSVPWDVRVFRDRFLPFEGYVSPDDPGHDPRPVINVTWNNSNTNSGSTSRAQEHYDGEFYIDCAALGIATDDLASDKIAKERAQEVVRYVRNILNYWEYDTLALPGTVCQGQRIREISSQGDDTSNAMQTVSAYRVRIGVTYKELPPETPVNNLEDIVISTEITPQGEVIINNFNFGGQ